MTPIDKNDRDINDENNYRPIFVVGHIEKQDSYQINGLLKGHSFILVDQSAYLKMNSTQTSLHHVVDD